MRSGFESGSQGGRVLIELQIFCRDGQGPSVRHGVTSVDSQIQQNLMQLGGIAENCPEILLLLSLEGNGSGEGLPDNPAYLREDITDLQLDTLTVYSSGKGDDLLYDLCPALGIVFNGRQDKGAFRVV